MKKSNEETINHRLEIGERLKCGEVFIRNVDGYTSFCAVECQLCEDRSICSLTEYLEHIEIWHSDWEEELQHDEMQEIADEFATSMDEVVQPFEKVLIVTETKTTSNWAFCESEEISEPSIQCETETNENFDSTSSYTESLDGSTGVEYIVNVADILLAKPQITETTYFEQHNNDICSSNDSTTATNTFEEIVEENENLFSSNNVIEKKESNFAWMNSHFNQDDDEEDNENEDLDRIDNNFIERSEDSGVEKSEISSFTASTPQHLTSEDEANFEPTKLNIKEQIRRALNEPPPKPKLTTVHIEKLIDLYKDHPRLWQQTHSEYNSPQLCRKAWKEIARTWNRACQLNFSIRDIRLRISTLCQRYLKERRRHDMAYEINEPKIETIISRFKYFDKLKFLDTHQSTPYEEYTSRLAQEHEKLLEVYSHFPLLWSKTDRDQKSVEQREKAYYDICTALQLLGIHIPPKMIRQRLTALRKRYRLEKMRHLHCKLQRKTFETSFKQYESMKFLDRYIAPFVCDTCGKIFRKSIDYRMHILYTEHEEKENYAESSESSEQTLVSISNEKSKQIKEKDCLDSVDDFECENLNYFPTKTSDFETSLTKEIVNNFCVQNNINDDDLFSIKTALKDSLLEQSNTVVNFKNNSNQDPLISMKSNLKDSINDFNNIMNVPILIQNFTETEDLTNYFNGEQFFTLSTAAESTTRNLDNQSPLTNESTINTVFKDSLNNLHIQSENLITLQVLEKGVEISSNQTPYVPIEFILNERLNNLVSTQMPQASENFEIVAQYLNADNLVPITTIVGDAQKVLKNPKTSEELQENATTTYFSNGNHFIPMAIGFEETDTIFQKGSNKNTENYLNQVQYISMHEASKDLVISCASLEENQITQNSSIMKNNFENSNAKSPNIDFQIHEIEATSKAESNSIENETKKYYSNENCISNSENINTNSSLYTNTVQQTNQKEKTVPEKLTAKIECANLQLEVDLGSKKQSADNNSEPSLLGRLPREQALELIHRYKDFPELWHPEHVNYTSRRLRRIAWRSLAKDLNKNLNTNFNWLQIQRKILDYVKYYRHERRRVQNKKGCTQWSFYDHFSFLDQVMSPPTDLEKRIQQRTLTLKIIEIYKYQPQMWNTRHPQYTKRNQRQRSVKEMCKRLKDIHEINIDEAKLKQRLLELRKEYRSTKIAKITAERRNETFEPLTQFEFYDCLQFLEEHVPPFNCSDCKMEFKCFTEYNLHMKREHKDYKRAQPSLVTTDIDSTIENICHICGIKFTLRHNLLQHLNRHYAGRTFACSVCGKKFYTTHTLKEHERIHSKEAGVICADCGQTFVNMSKLNQHMKRHRNQRDHTCEQCGKTFYTAFDRDRHVRRHLQIRDKICPVCGKAFVMGSAYYSHMKLHSDKKEYSCAACGKEFAQYAGLYKHRKRYHPNY